jgi:hypothetical protein
LLSVAALGALGIVACAAVAQFYVLGNPETSAGIDPRTIALTFTKDQWIVMGLAWLISAILVAIALAASVVVAANPTHASPRSALAGISAHAMQIFWLQIVVAALALAYSPFVVFLLWALTAFAVPVALCEKLSPSDAMDRAWSLSLGARPRILALEFLALLPPLAVAAAMVAFAFFWLANQSVFDFPLWARAVSGVVALTLLILAFQSSFVVLTRLYLSLATQSEVTLHARAASSVNS